MSPEADDWRLGGQDGYLAGAVLVHKAYRAYREGWDHDHCEFCWAKFMDADVSPEHGKFIEENPDVLTEGWTTTAEHEHGADYHWICDVCFDDFRERLGWRTAQDG